MADLLGALERTGDQPGRTVSAHLDPILNEAAKAAVALGLAEPVSAFTGKALQAGASAAGAASRPGRPLRPTTRREAAAATADDIERLLDASDDTATRSSTSTRAI